MSVRASRKGRVAERDGGYVLEDGAEAAQLLVGDGPALCRQHIVLVAE